MEPVINYIQRQQVNWRDGLGLGILYHPRHMQNEEKVKESKADPEEDGDNIKDTLQQTQIIMVEASSSA